MLRDDPAVYIRSLQFFHKGCCDSRNGISMANPVYDKEGKRIPFTLFRRINH